MRIKTNIIFSLLFFVSLVMVAQIDSYDYKRELSGITDSWYKITLPDALFEKVQPTFSDIRIYGVTKEKDTIEAAYVLKQKKGKISNKKIDFDYLNRSSNSQGSFVTFKLPVDEAINQIQLFFEEDNFDRLVKIEGSHHLKKWYTIVDDYRVLSIKNELTNYNFSNVKLPDSKYAYFRILVKGDNAPKVMKAEISLQEVTQANYKKYDTKSVSIKENKQKKTTVIDIDLHTAVPISYISIKDNNDFDFYRPLRIEYLRDSSKTQKGWRYNYQVIRSGTLNSIEENEFKFENQITDRLRIHISNRDNQPLDITGVDVKGNVHHLEARFTAPASYFLVYGNENAKAPSYDIQYMSDRVPEALKEIQLGDEKGIEKAAIIPVEPLFENKVWLWIVMGIVILLLGGFTVMMMKKK